MTPQQYLESLHNRIIDGYADFDPETDAENYAWLDGQLEIVNEIENWFSEQEHWKALDAIGMQFGAVVKFGRQEPVLAITDGKIWAGSIRENNILWNKSRITMLVPLGTKEQIAEWGKAVQYIDTTGLIKGEEND